jgi:hypothetical protein
VLPIRCGDHELEVVQHKLPCALAEFPCKYLGLPLSLKKLKREHLQPILAPHLFAVVPPARRKKRTVKEAFTNHDWVVDIQGALTLNIITEYIQLWDLVHGF